MGQPYIEPLAWDFEHLGISCGRVSFDSVPQDTDHTRLERDLTILLKKSAENLIVIKLPANFHNLLCSLCKNSVFIDSEITFKFSQQASCNAPSSKHEVTFSDNCNPAPFESLATEMEYSRYYVDPKIPYEKAESMWIDSIRNHCMTLADEIATVQVNKEPVGIITIQKKGQGVINLHIVGVLKKFQGRGIGKSLLQQVVHRYGPGHTIFVETLIRNRGAIKFYQQNGFVLDSLNYVLHHWKQ